MTSDSDTTDTSSTNASEAMQEWQQESEKRKLFWIVTTLAFLFTTVFQWVLYLLQGTINIVLVCVMLAALVMGMVFKFRYQSHKKSKPEH